MKLFKRLFLIALACICVMGAVAGCGQNNLDEDWVEVQSITYTTTDGEKVTHRSMCIWDLTRKKITQEEYENAPYELKRPSWINETAQIQYEDIDSNRTEFIAHANRMTEFTIYCGYYKGDENHYSSFEKITYNSYELFYIKIKFINNQKIQMNVNDRITDIVPLSFEINYFVN